MTKTQPSNRYAIAMLLALSCAAVRCPAQEKNPPAVPTPNDALLKEFQRAGKNASLTILPTLLADQPSKQVGQVVGLILEKAGMGNLTLGSDEFRPAAKAELPQTIESLADFVKSHPPGTDYVLFTEFRVGPQRKFNEVRTIVMNKKGELVWNDSQTPSDAAFKRIKPVEPMDCCMLVVERLRQVLKLPDLAREEDSNGKLTRQWKEQTGVPEKAEMDAMHTRAEIFKKSRAHSTLLVYPPRAGRELSPAGSADLSELINKAQLTKASAAETGPDIKIEPNMNEQIVLWKMARAFRDHVRSNKPDTDYILFAHYLMGDRSVGAVHFVVCDRKGEWVIVDFQNDHHSDFKAIHPKSREDCDRLVERRLQSYCH